MRFGQIRADILRLAIITMSRPILVPMQSHNCVNINLAGVRSALGSFPRLWRINSLLTSMPPVNICRPILMTTSDANLAGGNGGCGIGATGYMSDAGGACG